VNPIEPITVYANRDLRTLERGTDVDTLDSPEDELTGSYEYLLNRDDFRRAYKNWNRDQNPLLQIHDELSNVDIYLGQPSARRIYEAIEKNEASVQIF